MKNQKLNNAMFDTWKKAKIQEDVSIRNIMDEIAKTYGYTIEEGFGLYIHKVQKAYREPKYAEVTYSGWSFQISTVSSHWDVLEATIYIKQLKEATECAAELNTFIRSMDYQLKKDFEKEMEIKMAESENFTSESEMDAIR